MPTIRHSLFTLALLLVAALTAHAQPPERVLPGVSRLGFDHSGTDVDRFEQQVDDGPWVAAPATDVGPGTEADKRAFVTDFLPMTPGSHTVRLRACLSVLCADSDPFVVLQVVVIAPGRLRVLVTP